MGWWGKIDSVELLRLKKRISKNSIYQKGNKKRGIYNLKISKLMYYLSSNRKGK